MAAIKSDDYISIQRKRTIEKRSNKLKNAARTFRNVQNHVARVFEEHNLPYLLVYIDKHGKVNTTTKGFDISKLNIQKAVVNEKSNCDCTEGLEETGYDQDLDLDDLCNSSCDKLRAFITSVTVGRGEGSRKIWGVLSKKPEWWPAELPFAAPGSIVSMKNESTRRKFNKIELMELAYRYLKWKTERAVISGKDGKKVAMMEGNGRVFALKEDMDATNGVDKHEGERCDDNSAWEEEMVRKCEQLYGKAEERTKRKRKIDENNRSGTENNIPLKKLNGT